LIRTDPSGAGPTLKQRQQTGGFISSCRLSGVFLTGTNRFCWSDPSARVRVRACPCPRGDHSLPSDLPADPLIRVSSDESVLLVPPE
ncbi:hypothetical protein XENOCAPTIV_008086, partial [Xenoophorus captivus]